MSKYANSVIILFIVAVFTFVFYKISTTDDRPARVQTKPGVPSPIRNDGHVEVDLEENVTRMKANDLALPIGVDTDDDGLVDFPQDPGAASLTDIDEKPDEEMLRQVIRDLPPSVKGEIILERLKELEKQGK